MSVITDSLRLLGDRSSAFALLPGINYFYYYTQTGFSTTGIILPIVLSAFLYNFLSGGSVITHSGKNADNETGLDIKNTTIFILIGLPWAIAFGLSLCMLMSIFGNSGLWAEGLVAVSVVFISLLVSDLVLLLTVSEYKENSGSEGMDEGG